MKQNEINFIKFWEENLKGKVHVNTELIVSAYNIYYETNYTGGRCGHCLSTIGQDLKNIYYRLIEQNNK